MDKGEKWFWMQACSLVYPCMISFGCIPLNKESWSSPSMTPFWLIFLLFSFEAYRPTPIPNQLWRSHCNTNYSLLYVDWKTHPRMVIAIKWGYNLNYQHYIKFWVDIWAEQIEFLLLSHLTFVTLPCLLFCLGVNRYSVQEIWIIRIYGASCVSFRTLISFHHFRCVVVQPATVSIFRGF